MRASGPACRVHKWTAVPLSRYSDVRSDAHLPCPPTVAAGEEQAASDLLSDYDPPGTLWGRPGAAVPTLDEACLPFARGALTFGSGMGVKVRFFFPSLSWLAAACLALTGCSPECLPPSAHPDPQMTVTRLQQWAAGEGLGDAMTSASTGAAMPQFPLLRTAADLLMMPKELLMESAIRRDVAQALSTRSMLLILEGFRQDEYAQEKIDPAILAVMRDELALAPSFRPPLSDFSYRQHPDEAMLIKVEARGRRERDPVCEHCSRG